LAADDIAHATGAAAGSGDTDLDAGGASGTGSGATGPPTADPTRANAIRVLVATNMFVS
jgi:hypothetical protein